MPEIKDILEAIQTNTTGLRAELDGVKSSLETERQEFKNKVAAYDGEFIQLKAQLETEQKAREQLELAQKRGQFAGTVGANGKVKSAEEELQTKAFEKFLRYGAGTTSKTNWTSDEEKALSSLVDTHGGYLLLPDFETEIIRVAQHAAEIRGVANVGQTSRDSVQVGKLTQRATIAWGNEGVKVDPQDLERGLENMPINEVTALVLVPNSTLEDSAADIFAELSMVFGEDIAYAEDVEFAIGDGVKKPEGILNAAVKAHFAKTGVAAALFDSTHNGVDALISVMYKPKKIYRANGTWAFNSTTEAEIRKLKDGQGRYIWEASTQVGTPAMLLGRPIINPEGMPDIAAGSFPVVFGDFRRGYRIRDRRGMTVQRLVERYAEYRQTGFLVTKRVGGQVVLDEAFSCLKVQA